jgi:hypothetical protein
VPEGIPHLNETHRKRAVDFTRALTALKGNVGDDSSEKDINEWKHKVASHAAVCFGSHWEQIPNAVESVLRAVHEGFTKKLQSAWVLETQRDPALLTTMSWDELVEWVFAHTTHEPYNESRENRTKLISNQVLQKSGTLNSYLLHFNRMVLPIENISEDEKIVYFLRGLSTDLGPLCQTDTTGQEWTCFTSLVEHARMKDMEVRARNAALRKSTPHNPGKRWRNNRTVAAIAHGDNTVANAASQGSGQRGRSRGSGRGSGRAPGGSGSKCLAVAQGGTHKQGGRGSGRGGGRGGGARSDNPRPSTQAAAASPAKPMEVAGPDDGPCRFNTGISNKQGRWLLERNRCFHCFKPMSECRAERGEGRCPKRSAPQAMAAGAVPGAPGWQ